MSTIPTDGTKKIEHPEGWGEGSMFCVGDPNLGIDPNFPDPNLFQGSFCVGHAVPIN